MFVELKKILFFVFVLLNFFAVNSFAQLVGFESEYATVGFLEPKWGQPQIERSKQLLEIVKSVVGGSNPIQTERWDKRPDKSYTVAYWIDGKGRRWKVDPESVNSTGLDGLELVTPPLDSAHDIQQYRQVLSQIKKKKIVMRGIRSSGHITVDVSHLINGDDYSKIVDLILTIENRWVETYEHFGPRRYGTIVNRFSVPLAADQQDLIKELEQLPRSQRTRKNIAKIFEKYVRKEAILREAVDDHQSRRWKYRAANYAKLLGLNDNQIIPAIEFRIADLGFGDDIEANVAYLRKLVNEPHLDDKFKYPFGPEVLDWKQASRVLESRVRPNSPRPIAERDLANPSLPVGVEGKYVTLGFEAEFADSGSNKVLTSDRGHVNQALFPFLSSEKSKESTGNTEVRSTGGEWSLAEVIEQMISVRAELGSDLRGFHMHIRIPMALIGRHDQSKLKAWMNLFGDAVFAWRLQNRKTFWALKSRTVGRPRIEEIDDRETVRLDIDAEYWDFEIRGYMREIEMIGMMAQKLMTILNHPEYIHTSFVERMSLSNNQLDYDGREELLEKFVKRFYHRELTAQEKSAFREITSDVFGDKSHAPFFNLENMSGLTDDERRQIQDANFEFYKEVMTVIRNRLAGQPADESKKQYRWRIKRWAIKFNMQALIESLLLREIPGTPRHNTAGVKADSAVVTQVKHRNSRIADEFQQLSNNQKVELLERMWPTLTPKEMNLLIFQFVSIPVEGTLPFILKAAQKTDEDLRKTAISALIHYADDADAITEIERGLSSTRAAVKKAALSSIAAIHGPAAIQVLRKYWLTKNHQLQDSLDQAFMLQPENVKVALLAELPVRGDQSDASGRGIYNKLLNDSPETTLVLLESWAKTGDEDGMEAAVMEAKKLPVSDRAVALLEFLIKKFPTEVMKLAVLKHLRFQNSDHATEIVLQLLKDPEERVQREALLCIMRFGQKAAVTEIERMMAAPESKVRSGVKQRILREIHNLAYLPIAEKALHSRDSDLREAAFDGLTHLDDERVVTLIKPFILNSRNQDVQLLALEVLKVQISTPTAMEVMQEAFKIRSISNDVGDAMEEYRRARLDHYGSITQDFSAYSCQGLFL